MKRDKAAAAVLVAVTAALLVSAVNVKTGSTTQPMEATVIGPDDNLSIGLAAGSGLNFGRVIANGMNSTRTVELTADYGLARLQPQGNISEFVETDSPVIVENTTEAEVTFVAGNTTGNLTGTMRIKTYTPKNRLGKPWIKLQHFYFSRL